MSNIKKLELKLLSVYLLCIGWGVTPVVSTYLFTEYKSSGLIHLMGSYVVCDVICSVLISTPIWFLPYKDIKIRVLRQMLIIILYIFIISTAWFVIFN